MEIDQVGPHPRYRIEQYPGVPWLFRWVAPVLEWLFQSYGKSWFHYFLASIPVFAIGLGALHDKEGFAMEIIHLICMIMLVLIGGMWFLGPTLALCSLVFMLARYKIRDMTGWGRASSMLSLQVQVTEVQVQGRPKRKSGRISRCFPLVDHPEGAEPRAMNIRIHQPGFWVLEIRPTDEPPWVFPDLQLESSEAQSLREVLEKASHRALELHGQGEAEVPEEIRQLQQQEPGAPRT
jgi:hypothetical protein